MCCCSPQPWPQINTPITFSKVVLEVDSRTTAESDAEIRSAVLSAMKGAGLNVVGGESAVFEIDKSRDARFILGARLVGADHRLTARHEELQLAFVWELLDTRTEEIVYTVEINGYAADRPHIRARLAEDLAVGAAALNGVIILTPPTSSAQTISRALFWAAFEDGVDRVLKRPAFAEILAAPPGAAQPPAPRPESLALKRCADVRALPADLSAALASVVSLSDGASPVPVGSGVILSPDGWLRDGRGGRADVWRGGRDVDEQHHKDTGRCRPDPGARRDRVHDPARRGRHRGHRRSQPQCALTPRLSCCSCGPRAPSSCPLPATRTAARPWPASMGSA